MSKHAEADRKLREAYKKSGKRFTGTVDTPKYPGSEHDKMLEEATRKLRSRGKGK